MALLLPLLTGAWFYSTRAAESPPQKPKLVLWAWERRERLGFIAADEIGVAYLAKTIRIGSSVLVQPRLQPLEVPPKAILIAVVRVEARAERTRELNPEQIDHLAEEIASTARKPGVFGLQVDFDATASQREFYRRLLALVRQKMPLSISLSITALASWCAGDRWLAGLPIDEAVPMFFRMGPDDARIEWADIKEPLCQNSIGLSTDEPRARAIHGQRVYLFHPRPWSAADVTRAREEFLPQ